MLPYDLTLTTLAGDAVPLATYRDRVLLIVNVASRCGFTPQYEALEALYRRHRGEGFAVLGFPCDQFGHQEPGDAAEILRFCESTYDVTFPLFAKVDVNGPHAHPLYRHLKAARPGLLGSEAIKWNFTKFLVDRAGDVRDRFAPTVTPEHIEPKVVALLGEA
jgi:glutathione peroxidase